jgi:C4-dicarboxylate-specific signal transduction histidine kinase
MTDRAPDEAWLEAANCLATVTHQLSSAAHEANNLLQVIAGSAEMIQMSPAAPDKVLQRAATIAEHAHRVSTLLGSVRELSKFAPGVPGDHTDLVTLVQSALDVRRHALTRGRVAVSMAHDTPRPSAMVSWRPAMQLLLNLLLNAEEAVRGQDGAAIDVQVRRNDHEIILTIADNGPGIAEPPYAPFGLRPRADGPPQLGIGLAVARRLAADAGGSLELRRAREGTVAQVRLPAA